MCRFDTIRRGFLATLGILFLAGTGYGQAYEVALNWRAIGTTVVYNGRAGFSAGAASGIWFGADGLSLEVELPSGRLYRTADFETWSAIPRAGSRASWIEPVSDTLPESGARTFASPNSAYRVYAAGRWLWRSDDSGRHWTNLVAFRDTRLIGENIRAVAVSPFDPDRIAVVSEEGIWFSVDGGTAWNGLNSGLPNLRLTRLLAAPQGGRGLLAQWENQEVVEWLPGSKAAWTATGEWLAPRESVGWVDREARNVRLEVRRTDRPRLFRSLDGGGKWDDLTSDLPAQEIYGLAADRASGAIYLATERGIFYTLNNLEVASAPTSWVRLAGNLPREAALDILLTEGGNFLYASMAGEGVFLTHAPHRRRNPALLSAADFNSRSAAPGGLMSVIGMKLTQAQIAGRPLPILSATPDESQIQIPYDAVIPSAALELSTASGAARMELDLNATAPVIFTDRDGAPLLLDAENGELLDPSTPLRAGMRIQILLTGLGRVEPAWPAGVAAPAENAPKVVAPVRVWFGDQTLEVDRAELAPGYVGFYAVETKLPPVVDKGFGTLRVEAGGRYSNTIQVRTTLE